MSTCRTLVLPRWGAANLVMETRPVPEPGPGEVLIRLAAASVNYRDVVVVDGSYRPDFRLPLVPLSDGCGTVVAVGEGVTRFRPGDLAVPAYTRGWINGHATEEQRKHRTLGGPFDGVAREMIAVSQDDAVKVPPTHSAREWATVPIAALTAWSTLKAAGLLPGQWVLTQGTGGVALFALQFAKMMGASVVALTSTPEKADLLRALGADSVLDYRRLPEWADAVRELTGGGAHVAVETAGATLPETLKAMAFGGFVGVIGFLAAGAAPLDFKRMIGNTLRVQGIATGSRTSLEELVAAMAQHAVSPVIDAKRFALDQLADALAWQAGRHHIGKVVIDIA